jgi:hypothetical protein
VGQRQHANKIGRTIAQASIVLNEQSVTGQTAARELIISLQPASLRQVVNLVPHGNSSNIDGLDHAGSPHKVHAMEPLIEEV